MANTLHLYLKSFLLLGFVSIGLLACTDESAPTDKETNAYYAEYLAIYSSYDSLGNEATLVALNGYLDQYPERKDAAIFKGYILGKMEDYEAAFSLFEKLKLENPKNIAIYEYQSAFMLYDTTQLEAVYPVINEGLAIDDSSAYLMNNLAWLQILENNYSAATETVALGLSYDNNNNFLYRTGFIAATLQQDSLHINKYSSQLLERGIDDPTSLDSLLNASGAFEVLKSLD